MLLNCGIGEDSWDPTSPFWRRSVLGVHWKDWCGSSNTLASWWEELTHLKRPWCWERLKTGGEGDDRGWDGWMASSTQWTWVRVNSGNWWWTGRTYVLQFMGSQRVGHDCEAELNWIPRNSQESSPPPQFNFSALSLLYAQLSHPFMTTGKTIVLTIDFDYALW